MLRSHDWCAPEPDDAVEPRPLLDFSSGYVQRKLSELPNQGDRPPWRTHQNYLMDMLSIRFSPIDDGVMRFHNAGEANARAQKRAAE